MGSFFFSANDLKLHPLFAGDAFEHFQTQVAPLMRAHLALLGGDAEELTQVLHNRLANRREIFPAHLTTSSVVLSPDLSEALFLFHNKIREWVYPGGHADGDWFLLRSALRECFEETGLPAVEVLPPRAFSGAEAELFCPHLFQRYRIRANARDPEHTHYDAVFVFRASSKSVVIEPEESQAAQWVDVPTLEAHAQRPLGELRNGFDSLTARVCLAAMQSALGPVETRGRS